MQTNNSTYIKFNEQKTRLSRLIDEAAKILSGINLPNQSTTLSELSKKVNDDAFRIQVIGTFSNGKSTVINSLLGQEVLPAYARPCTAVINEVAYGDKKRAVLHFRNPLPPEMPRTIPEETLMYMKKYKGRQVLPLEIPADDIETHVVAPLGKDTDETAMLSPYEKVELFWPLDLLKNGVIIVDSPGLNSNETHTQMTRNFLTKADVILFVFDATHLCAEDEMQLIKGVLRGNGFEDIFFLINRFDLLKRERDRDDIKKLAELQLKGLSRLGDNGRFFISARDALDGKLKGDEALLKSSGVPELEVSLAKYLVSEKGKTKLAQPARELKRILNGEVLTKVIPQQRAMLSQSLNAIRKKYNEEKPRLDDLRAKRDKTGIRIERNIENLLPDIRRCLQKYFDDLATNIPAWVSEYEPEGKVKVFHPKTSSAAVGDEVVNYVRRKLSEEQKIWCDHTFNPLLAEKIEFLMESEENHLRDIFYTIDEISVNISGERINNEDIPVWKRVAGAGVGLLFGLDNAVLGGSVGLSKALAQNIAVEIGAWIVLGLLGILNPITLIGTALAAFFIGLGTFNKKMIKTIKEKVSDEVVKTVRGSTIDSIEETLSGLRSRMVVFRDGVVGAIDDEINDVEAQINAITTEISKGQASIDARKALLDEYEKRAFSINTELDEIILSLVN